MPKVTPFMHTATHFIELPDPSLPEKPRKFFWTEFGDPSNPDIVVCVHGLSRNGRDFTRIAEALAGQYRVLCPDIAGRGKSGWLANADDYNYAVYLSDIQAWIQHLDIKRLHWIGTSMGGIIGMMLAAGQKELVKSLVLNDVGAIVSAAGLKRILGYVGATQRFADRGKAKEYLEKILATFGIHTEADWQIMVDASFVRQEDGSYIPDYDPCIGKPFRAAASKEEGIADVDLSVFWNAVTCPVLIVRGTLSDILLHETALSMCQNRSNATLVEFSGVGHAPALLDREQITTITHWLETLEKE